jgi:hypothetical protein
MFLPSLRLQQGDFAYRFMHGDVCAARSCGGQNFGKTDNDVDIDAEMQVGAANDDVFWLNP